MALRCEKQDLEVLKAWWKWLDENRGARAVLRRAITADEVVILKAFAEFLSFKTKLKDGYYGGLSEPWRIGDNFYAAANICGLLARVKSDTDKKVKKESVNERDMALSKEVRMLTFAEQLAQPNKGGGSPIMSELRFQRLQKSHTPEDFFLQMCRAIDLLGGNVNIASMVDSVLLWLQEYEKGVDKEPKKRLAVRWATEYYTELSK